MNIPATGDDDRPGPVDPGARRHWWSIQPAPPARPISAKRAYAEVLGVFAAFFASSIILGAETLARRYSTRPGSWAVFTPAAVSQLGLSALAILVVVLLSARRGIGPRALGLGLPRKADGKPAAAQALRIGAWALMALVVGDLIAASLTSARISPPAGADASYYLVFGTAASAGAGIIEEMVVLAFVVRTLRQASRSLPEIVIVAVLLRCSYHDYYGPGVIGIAVWAIIFIWLYLRFGSVIPLVIVHFLWDATIFYSEPPQLRAGFAVARFAAVILLLLAAGLTWLADVANRPARGRERGQRGLGQRGLGQRGLGQRGLGQRGLGQRGLGRHGEGGSDDGRDGRDRGQPARARPRGG